VRWIAGFILSEGRKAAEEGETLTELSARDIKQVKGYDGRQIELAMEVLEKAEWVKPAKDGHRGSKVWPVNPQVRVKFAELAVVEAERRAKAREAAARGRRTEETVLREMEEPGRQDVEADNGDAA